MLRRVHGQTWKAVEAVDVTGEVRARDQRPKNVLFGCDVDVLVDEDDQLDEGVVREQSQRQGVERAGRGSVGQVNLGDK